MLCFCTNCEFHFAYEKKTSRARQLFPPPNLHTAQHKDALLFLRTRSACIMQIWTFLFAAAASARTSRLADSARRDRRAEATAQPERGQHHRRQANHHLRRSARKTARPARHSAQGRCVFLWGLKNGRGFVRRSLFGRKFIPQRERERERERERKSAGGTLLA